jgi:hypothetical protein
MEVGGEGHRALIWLPWVAGPEERAGGQVLVSLTEYKPQRWRDLPSVARAGMRLRGGWYGLPGAVGLHLWVDPCKRGSGSLSVWTNAADLRRWIGLPLHRQIMGRYRSRGTARSTQWTWDSCDRTAILAEAKLRLASARW